MRAPWLTCGLALVIAAASLARAADDAAVWTIAPAVVSQYLFRGTRYGGPALQPDVRYTRGPLAAGVWTSTPLADKVPGQSDPEIDGYAWYRIDLAPSLSLQPGFTVYTFPRAKPARGYYRATFEPNLGLNWTVDGVALSPKLYYDTVTHATTAELNAAYALPVRSIGSELDFGATVGTYEARRALADSNPATKSWGEYWQAGVTLPFQITARSRVSAGFAYGEGTDAFLKTGAAPKRPNPTAASRGVVTLTYTFTF